LIRDKCPLAVRFGTNGVAITMLWRRVYYLNAAPLVSFRKAIDDLGAKDVLIMRF